MSALIKTCEAVIDRITVGRRIDELRAEARVAAYVELAARDLGRDSWSTKQGVK